MAASLIHVQPDVCRVCPFSCACKPGQYPGREYDRLETYDGTILDQISKDATRIYYCHTSHGLICAGWLACFGTMQLLALNRQAEHVDWAAVCSFQTVKAVFRSGREAAEHGRGKTPAGFAGLRRQLGQQRTVDVDALAEEIADAVVQWAGADPKRLDYATKVLSYNPHLGPLPVKDGVYRYRPRWCTVCGDCPQYRPGPKAGAVGSVCRCGCRVAAHSYRPREINIVRKGEAGETAARNSSSQAHPVGNNSGGRR